MRFSADVSALFLALLGSSQAINIVLSNDDGWAELNVRTFFNSLTAAGDSVVLSAPANQRSGSGSLDFPPTPLIGTCQYNSCPSGSPATGSNATNPRLNYVNSFPVTSMRYGIQTLAPKFFGRAPDLALAGPNVGGNLGLSTRFSGTVGAATEAVKNGIPAIAFSGDSGDPTPWNAPPQRTSSVYADLATNVTNVLVASGKPYLPADTFVNVNFPAVSDTSCNSASQFKFVLSRIYGAIPLITPNDVTTCGSSRLPSESTVTGTAGCYVSVSVGQAEDKVDSTAAVQAVVLNKLRSLLSCLPA